MPKIKPKAEVNEAILEEFQEWCDSLGGCERVGNIHGVHRSTLSRYIAGTEPLPLLWIRYMWMSKELTTLKGGFIEFHDLEVGENEF